MGSENHVAGSSGIAYPGVTLPKDFIPDLQSTVDFWRNRRTQVDPVLGLGYIPQNPLRGARPVARAILLQDLWGGGSALAALLSAVDSPRIFNVVVVGYNLVADSAFRFSGFVNVGDADPVNLFIDDTTPAVSVESTADEVRDILLNALNQSLGVARTDIKVTLGNPMTNRDLIYTAEAELGLPGKPERNSESIVVPDPNDPKAEPKSFVGCWLIEFKGNFFERDDVFVTLETEEDTPGDADAAYMRGQSSIVCRKTFDSDTGVTEIVRDPMELGTPTPLKAGVKVILTDFADIGYAVTSSGYRDMTIDLSESDEFEEVEDEDV